MGMLQSWDEQGVTPLRLAAHTRDHGLESLYAGACRDKAKIRTFVL